MQGTPFLRRVALRNFKSIASCDVTLGALTFLIGPNGAGKSNFLEALHLVRDALDGTLDHALNVRSGLAEVRRKSSGHPTHFSIRLEFVLPSGKPGFYSFRVGALEGGAYEVSEERLGIGSRGRGPSFHVKAGKVHTCSEVTFPAVTDDRLALVAASGLPAFREAFDSLRAMGFYNLNPKLTREPQKPQDGRILKPAGENLTSVIGQLERALPQRKRRIEEFLQTVVPGIQGVERLPMGSLETLQFKQEVSGAQHPWKFPAMNMSDGTLRALGVLVALFQGDNGHRPTVVGIEEPETALHPAAAAALRAALVAASQTTQVIVTSHSPELLDDDGLDVDSLRAVAQRNGETTIGPVDAASRKMLREGLFSAGELLRMGQLEPQADEGQAPPSQASLFAELP